MEINNTIIKLVKIKELKSRFIYIATNKNFAKRRVFVVGRVDNICRHISLERHEDSEDFFFFSWIKQISDFNAVMSILKNILSKFYYKDMFIGVEFNKLKNIIDFVCSNNRTWSLSHIKRHVNALLSDGSDESNSYKVPVIVVKEVVVKHCCGYEEIFSLSDLEDVFKNKLLEYVNKKEKRFNLFEKLNNWLSKRNDFKILINGSDN